MRKNTKNTKSRKSTLSDTPERILYDEIKDGIDHLQNMRKKKKDTLTTFESLAKQIEVVSKQIDDQIAKDGTNWYILVNPTPEAKAAIDQALKGSPRYKLKKLKWKKFGWGPGADMPEPGYPLTVVTRNNKLGIVGNILENCKRCDCYGDCEVIIHKPMFGIDERWLCCELEKWAYSDGK